MNIDIEIPVIESTSGKVAVLERRIDYLTAKLDRGDYAKSTSAEFDRAEVSALKGAVRALRYCSAMLRPEADPVRALAWFKDEVLKFVEGEGAEEEFDLALQRIDSIIDTHKLKRAS